MTSERPADLASTFARANDADVPSDDRTATPILDIESPEVQTLALELLAHASDARSYLRAAHRHLSDANMLTAYSIDDDQPASVTLRENKGSCMQRMAALEALARAVGISTRVRALWTNKRFWFERLPLLKRFLPDAVLYTWPQFRIDGRWVDFDELHAPMEQLAASTTHAFNNAGESVFSAVEHQPVDFLGKTRLYGRPELDLSPLCTDAGIYDTRDELLAALERKPGILGRLVFKLLYDGRPIRRVPGADGPGGVPPRTSDTLGKRLLHGAQVAAVGIVAVMLVGTAWFVFAESRWVHAKSNDPRTAFLAGTPGTELIPLSVLKVLPDLFPDQFQPGGKDAGDWIEQFGFARRPVDDAGDRDLPVGFTISHYRPKSGSPSPVLFVGVSCAACHSAEFRLADDKEPVLVYGAGSNSINFLAWVDALRTVILDEERTTPGKIIDAYEAKYHTRLPLSEKLMIRAWLSQSREQFGDNLAKYDSPYSGAQLRDAESMPVGPSRTQPFRNLVRLILDRPAIDAGYSKIPAVFWESRRPWGQFDGGIHDFHARSAMAAMSSGATVDNMALPEIRDNIMRSTDYTMTLSGPQFEKVLGAKVDAARAERGRDVYAHHCAGCHGAPGATPGEWVHGKAQGTVFTPDAIGTDPERLNYRHAQDLAEKVHAHFPVGHPFHFERNDLRPLPPGAPGYPSPSGYISYPLEATFARAPYLHNGSVPTLAELINLERRRDVFYRGNNLYDVVRVGLDVPDKPDGRRYFRYDATERGNSNRGHEYPWRYPEGGWNPDNPDHRQKLSALQDLLEYLKTL